MNFKPATFRRFRNVAESLRKAASSTMNNHRCRAHLGGSKRQDWAAAGGLESWGKHRRLRVGRRRTGALGEPACGAPGAEPREGPRCAGDVENEGTSCIPNWDRLRQLSRPHTVPLGRAGGEGSGTGGRKAPRVQRPQPGVGYCDPAKDPGQRGVDPEPHRHRGIDLPPFCQHELLGTPLRKGAGELRRLPVGVPKN